MKDGDYKVTRYMPRKKVSKHHKIRDPNNGQATAFFSEERLLRMYSLGPKNGEVPRNDVLTYALNATAEVEFLEEEVRSGAREERKRPMRC